MRTKIIAGAALTALACLLGLSPARAQQVRITAPTPASEATTETTSEQPATPLSAEESALLGRVLASDGPAGGAPKQPLRDRPSLNGKPAALAVNRTDRPDGSGTVAVKKPFAMDVGAAALEANVGADVNLAAPPVSTYEPGGPLPGSAAGDAGSGAAWASLGVNNLASVDARVDPTNDQGKLGGTLKRSMPVGKKLSVTVQDSYSVTAPVAPQFETASPVTAAPGTMQVWNNQKSVKLNVAPTGTTLGAGWATASNDSVAHQTLSVEQKLYGPLHVTTAVTDLGRPSESKSISAGFKLNW